MQGRSGAPAPMVPEEGTEAEVAERMTEMVEGLNATIFVQNSSEFSGRLI